ncbi:STE24 endopeptidase [Nematocida sp. LUAm3]|nr:STE24 endopeptidase [Nematocida sp. LUAm3]KAI5173694.1 STE24 endopeptidase [Nematocida sp. LUAm2]KAI5176916.1 STE24 endopeptidase [Nematocida sp. LUAm1]
MKETQNKSISYKLYRKYFGSKVVVFLLTASMFHIIIFLMEIGYLVNLGRKLTHNLVPDSENEAMQTLMDEQEGSFSTQAKIARNSILRRSFGILSKTIDFLVVFAFFSHPLREQIMKHTKKYKPIVRINCSHMKEEDMNYLILAFLILGGKTLLFEWIFSKARNITDLLISLCVHAFRCIIIAPFLIWLFSSVYKKAKLGLILSAYIAIVVLIVIVNCTDLLPDPTDEYEVVPSSTFGPKLQEEIIRLNLENKIYWDKNKTMDNAALVKTGASKHIVIMGNLLKYGKEEFISFVAHEIGHAVDHSTEKKLFVTVMGLGITCGIMIFLLHFLTPKYTARGVSKFSVLAFIMIANIYIASSLVNMFYNNLGILSEVNADMYAKSLGYSKPLANGLFHLSYQNNAPMFHSLLFTHYIHDHPTISSRISYLYK